MMYLYLYYVKIMLLFVILWVCFIGGNKLCFNFKKVFFVIIFYMKYVVCVIFRKSIEKIE